MATGPSLEMRRNSTEQFEYILEEDGEPVDITDHTIYFTVKTKSETKALDTDDADAIVKKVQTDHDDPENGRTVITIDPDETKGQKPGTYFYDVIWKQDHGDAIAAVFGRFELLPNATQDLS